MNTTALFRATVKVADLATMTRGDCSTLHRGCGNAADLALLVGSFKVRGGAFLATYLGGCVEGYGHAKSATCWDVPNAVTREAVRKVRPGADVLTYFADTVSRN